MLLVCAYACVLACGHSELSLVERGLKRIPIHVAERRGDEVTSLNLSENSLTNGEAVEPLKYFTKLESLVVDKNQLEVRLGRFRVIACRAVWCYRRLSFVRLDSDLFGCQRGGCRGWRAFHGYQHSPHYVLTTTL